MRNYLVAILFCFGLTAQKCNQPETFAVQISLTQTQSYCGGAMPPPELIVDLNTPKPYKGSMVYLFNDDLVCLDSIAADDTDFKTPLDSGHYTMRLVRQVQELDAFSTEKERCEIAFAQRILSMFDISRDTALTVNLHFGCDPCSPPPP